MHQHKLTRAALALALTACAAAALTACGGGGGSSSNTTTVSGTVVDGYLSGATVCVDSNKNGQCDSGEPSATTNASGAYAIKGVSEADASSAPIVAYVPSTAVDSDDSTTTVGSNFVLMAPAGKTVVSPLTTLVQQVIAQDGSKTAATAASEISAAVSSLASTDLFADYVKASDSNAHTAAKVVANSLKANYDTAVSVASSQSKAAAIVLGEVAKKALQSQGTTPDASKSIGAEDAATLRAAVAARTATASATQDVTLNFDLVQGSTSVRCGDALTLANTALWDHTSDTKLATAGTTGAQSTAGQLVDTRFYVSNVVLLDASGNAVPLVMNEVTTYQSAKGVALLDFGYLSGTACTTAYNTTITGKVAPGSYTGIALTIGVPVYSADFSTKMNHVNAADTTVPAPLQVTATNWTWQSGRKFMKLEFKPDTAIDKVGATTTAKWNVHIGSTGCSGDPTTGNETACTNPNRLALSFPSFNAATQKIVLDIAQLWREADVSFEGGGAAGCMSGTTDPECPPIFKALGLDLATGKTLSGSAVQTVFSVR